MQQRIPVRQVDAAGELIRVVGGQAGERQDFARARVQDDGSPVVAEMGEALLGRPLDVGVDRQLDASSLDRLLPACRPHFAAAAVDDDEAVAVLAHEQPVVLLLDAGLPHHRSGLGAGVLGPRQIGFAGLADVAEEVRPHLALGILAGRHFLLDDAWKLEPARA